MYSGHFGLKQPPFRITPNTDFFFAGGNRGAVLDALVYAVLHGEGIVKVVGEVGSGKTMLCRMLETRLPEHIDRVFLANPSVAPQEVLFAIAFELQLALPPGADRLQVMQALQNDLIERHAAGRQVVVFVEEAQGMPIPTLEEIRLLSNLETRRDKLLQIVLFGQPELDENLNQLHIRQLKERITHSFYLGPLAKSDIGEYLDYRLRMAGYAGPPVFTKAAIRRMTIASKGLVRRLNILADKAMLAAFAENVYAITATHVQIAIRDSEFSKETERQSKYQWLLWILLGLLLVVSMGLAFWTFAPSSFKNQKTASTTALSTSIKTVTPVAKSPIIASPLPVTSLNTTQDKHEELPSLPIEASVQNSPLDHRLETGLQWLSSVPESTLILQLLGTDQANQLEYQLKRLSGLLGAEKIHVYKSILKDKPLYTVIYGNFQDISDAKEAITKLPITLQSYHPRIRTAGGILKEIKSVQ